MIELFAAYRETIEGRSLLGAYSSREKAIEAVEIWVAFWNGRMQEFRYYRGADDAHYYEQRINDPYLFNEVISIEPFGIDKPIWTP